MPVSLSRAWRSPRKMLEAQVGSPLRKYAVCTRATVLTIERWKKKQHKPATQMTHTESLVLLFFNFFSVVDL